jgi:cysteine desulfurase/selenocysteine lyase
MENTSISLSNYPVEQIRQDFPLLQQMVNGYPLVYLDNGATTQKPLSVLEAMDTYYRTYNSNVHRGVHHLSQLATDAFERTRFKVQGFIHAAHAHEIIYTKGTTEAINLVASCYAKICTDG